MTNMGVRRAETGEHERELETCMKCIRMAECIHLITSKSKCGKEIVFEPGSNMNKTKPRDIRKRAIYIYMYIAIHIILTIEMIRIV